MNSPYCENLRKNDFRYTHFPNGLSFHYMQRFDWWGTSAKYFELKDFDLIEKVNYTYLQVFCFFFFVVVVENNNNLNY